MSYKMDLDGQYSLFADKPKPVPAPEDIILKARRMQGAYLSAMVRAAWTVICDRVIEPVVLAYRRDDLVDLLSRLDDSRLKDIGTKRAELVDFAARQVRARSKQPTAA